MTVNQETLHAVSEAMLHEDAVSVSLPGTDWMVVRKSRYESLSSNSERAEAAEARIAELEAENEKLRAALDYYAKVHDWPADGPWGVTSTDFGEVARAALSEHEKE
tara:strand:- start:1409 stop:1726 length:318 start_codon:yes stop_codon:yes gene_type:complete